MAVLLRNAEVRAASVRRAHLPLDVAQREFGRARPLAANAAMQSPVATNRTPATGRIQPLALMIWAQVSVS